MFPELYNGMNARVHLRIITTLNRRHKLDSQIMNINIPPKFVASAVTHTSLLIDNTVLVCDGGIDHTIPVFPPPNKVIILF
jgi:hypothetical protein